MLDTQDQTQETTKLYSAHYSKFIRSKKNLRGVVEREELLEKIKADSGVKIPGYVYSESFNENGLMLIFDMNSRHWCLEQLEKDEEYKKNGGSFELPYLILSDEIANDPVRERLFMISLGTTNKQLSPKEIGRGYVEARELGLQKLREEFEGWENLPEQDKLAHEKKFATKIVNKICKESGKSKVIVYQIFRVFDASDRFAGLAESIEKNRISVSSADELIKVAEKSQKPVEKLLKLAEKSAFDRGNSKVSDKDIEVAAKIAKHPEMNGFVDSGAIPTQMFDAVLDAAKKSKKTITELVANSSLFGGVSEENLANVVSCLVEEDDDDDEVEEKKPGEKEIISDSEILEAKDYIQSASLEISNFILKDLESCKDIDLLAFAEKLSKAMKVLEKLE